MDFLLDQFLNEKIRTSFYIIQKANCHGKNLYHFLRIFLINDELLMKTHLLSFFQTSL